jgi:hypothetical protein
MTERYLIAINSMDRTNKIKVLVLDQNTMRIKHESVYTRDLLEIIKSLFMDYYGPDHVKFRETVKESDSD